MIIVRYILDEDAEDTEDAEEDRSSFHSRTTMYVEAVAVAVAVAGAGAGADAEAEAGGCHG